MTNLSSRRWRLVGAEFLRLRCAHRHSPDRGAIFHPEHFKSTKTRADVLRELEAARKDGSLWYLERSLPVPVKNATPGRTREEVRNEVLNLTVEERRELHMIGGR